MQKKLTITINENVYKGLHRVIGRGKISQFIEDLLRPHVLKSELESEYKKMSLDKTREADAHEWSENLIGDGNNDSR